MHGPHDTEILNNWIRQAWNEFCPTNIIGFQHAIRVEGSLNGLIDNSKFSMSNLDRIVLNAAALLHNFDLFFQQPFQDIIPSFKTENLQGFLSRNAFLNNNPTFIENICYLIENIENTSLFFPSKIKNGKSNKTDLQLTTLKDQQFLLDLLKEADALVTGSEETILQLESEWRKKGLPIIENQLSQTNWQWMDSIVGNLRLLEKRIIIDSKSLIGKTIAEEIYQKIEKKIENYCGTMGITFEPENNFFSMRNISMDRTKISDIFTLRQFIPWEQVPTILRSTPLKYDESIHPYSSAHISNNIVKIDDLTPMALYVMKSRLDGVQELYDALLVKYCLCLWQLSGILIFQYGSMEDQRIAPPIIEITKQEKINKPYFALVDGLHRCIIAKENGEATIRGILLEGVQLPLVPLPTRWKNINIYDKDNPPKQSNKRLYRYSNYEDVPSKLRKAFKITKDNFQYFFYRDLQKLGSRGKRFEENEN